MEQVLVNIIWITMCTLASGTFIDVKPRDTWGLLGKDAVITCQVTFQTEGQYVFWKKLNSGGSEVITYDNQTLNEKYEIRGEYSLVIKDVKMEDEGHYILDTGEENVQISLAVAVPMQNMTLTWGGSLPFSANSEANLTCNASNSRPAANLRWLRGSHDVTDQAFSKTKCTRADGYGDSVSIIKTIVGSVDVPYLCIADLPGHRGVRTEIAFPPIIGGSPIPCGHSVWLLLILSLYSYFLT